jgi:hypothetical protein
MNGSQDALVIEQTDGSEDKSRKVSPAQIKQYVLGNSIDDIYSVMGQMGAKNLLVPKWTETQTTENGVTYTFNADGTVVMNTDESGATADTNCNLKNIQSSTDNIYPAGTYTISGCPSGGTGSTYRTWARAYRPGDSSSSLTGNLYDEGNGVTFTVNETFQLAINLTVKKNYVCNNLTWKPMLRFASDTDNTYQPYAKTNRQLTEVIGDLSQTGLTGDSVAAQLGDAGEQLATKFNDGVYTSNNNEIIITSEHRYDTIIVIGGFGSNTVFDVIFVNSTAGVLKLGNTGSTITSVDTYNFKYKAASEWFQGKIFSAHGAKLTIS